MRVRSVCIISDLIRTDFLVYKFAEGDCADSGEFLSCWRVYQIHMVLILLVQRVCCLCIGTGGMHRGPMVHPGNVLVGGC